MENLYEQDSQWKLIILLRENEYLFGQMQRIFQMQVTSYHFLYINYLVLWYLNALIDVHQSWEFEEICFRRNSRKVGLNKVTKYANFFSFCTNLLSSVKCMLCKFHISYSTLQCASNTCKSTIRLNTPITFASYILGNIIEILAGTRHARIDN